MRIILPGFDILTSSKQIKTRIENRPTHVKNLSSLVDQKVVVLGGAYTKEHVEPGTTPPFLGSCVNIAAESKEKVWEILRSDIYATSGVWNLEKAQVNAVFTGFRRPHETY